MSLSRAFLALGITVTVLSLGVSAAERGFGTFEAQADVGNVTPPGSAEFDKEAGEYRIKGAGQNIWGLHDDFHFVYRKSPADFVLSAEVSWKGEGKNPHRKAGCMLRQGLEPDAAYADVMVHGDGLISLQYREKAGGATKEIKSAVKGPAAVRLERRGETVTAFVATRDGKGDKREKSGKRIDAEEKLTFEPIGSVRLPLKELSYAGLAVCSHEANVEETAVFSRVAFEGEVARPVPGK